jgi:hypothetical protein
MNTIQEIKKEFRVPNWRMDAVKDFLAKINRRATKNNLPPIELILGNEETQTIKDPQGIELVNKYQHFALSTPSVKINGYSFVASIEHDASGNMIRKAPAFYEKELDASYWKAAPNCEHCKIERYRKDTFLLEREADKKIIQVGRQCLRDFLGHDAEAGIAGFEYLRDAIDEFSEYEGDGLGGREHVPSGYELKSYLTWVAMSIRIEGWTSGAMAYERGINSTAGNVAGRLNDRRGEFKDRPSDKDIEVADKSFEWLKGLKGESDYERNLKAIEASGMVSMKAQGFAASIVRGYLKTVEQAIENEKKADSAWLGAAGDKIEANVTIVKPVALDGMYGMTTLYIMRDDTGNKIVWNSSSYHDGQTGNKFRIKGTIKKVDDYKGEKQTVLTRCKVMA